MRTRVKICGITRREDALEAVRRGADALGFIFWKGSPRLVRPEDAATIGRGLPALVTKVGVFVDCSPQMVSRIVKVARLDAVQLHGHEDPADYERCGAALIKAVSLADAADVRKALAYPSSVTVLVDARDAVRRGGTGTQSNWTLARQVARRRPIMLAGGLGAGNIEDAIRRVNPWAIDVSSGVEDRPGYKNATKMANVFRAVAQADRKAG